MSFTQPTNDSTGAMLMGETVREVPLRVAAPPASAGLVRRFFTVHRHVAGFLLGAFAAHVDDRRRTDPSAHGFVFAVERALAAVAQRMVDPVLVERSLAIQLRRRLELLGPTFIKLGQIMSLREDLFPPAITGELKLLLDRQPVVPFALYEATIQADLGRSLESMFL